MKLYDSIWKYRRKPQNGLNDFLLLFPSSGHWLNLNVSAPMRKKYAAHGGWLADTDCNDVLICLKGGKEWKVDSYRILGEVLQWKNELASFDLDVIETENFPDDLLDIAEEYLSSLKTSDKPTIPNQFAVSIQLGAPLIKTPLRSNNK